MKLYAAITMCVCVCVCNIYMDILIAICTYIY